MSLRWLEDAAGDIRLAGRMFRRSLGFTAVSAITLALGIGANTAVFSIINGALLRPLPYKDPSRLVAIWDHGIHEAQLAKIFASYLDYEEFRRHARTIENIAAATWATGGQTMTGRGRARNVLAIPVSDSFFTLFGVAPARGRTFTEDDRRRGCSIVLSDHFWRSELGSAADIVGKALVLDRRSCTVLGVMPPTFAFYPQKTDLWTLITPDFKASTAKLVVGLFARLRPNITLAQAQAELSAEHAALHRNEGWYERDITPVVYNMQEEFTWLAGRNLRTTLFVLLGAVVLVVLIACLNVANLLLGRSLGRQREMAVRAALGSGQGRLIRQMLAEGMLLALAGGAIGVVAAFAAIRYFIARNPVELPVGANIAINVPVLAFTLALSIATALVFALVPAWKAARVDLNDTLKSGGHGSVSSRGHQRIARLMLVGQIAFSVVLLAGAGLLMESVLRMGSAPLGFDFDHVITASFALPSDRYADEKRRVEFCDEVNRKLEALPGVQAAAFSSQFPPYGGQMVTVDVQGKPVDDSRAAHDTMHLDVSNGYFEVLKVPLVSGRFFSNEDRHDSEPVAVVNQAFVQKYFPDREPLGQRIRIPEPGNKGPWLTIVGVAANEKHSTVYQEMAWIESATVFQPLAQQPPNKIEAAVRTVRDQASIGPEMEREITSMDSDVPVIDTETLRHGVEQQLAYPQFRAILFSAFALISLLLAAVGLHGILQQFVAQHTREIGVRMAIGARTTDILRLIVTQGGQPVIAGLLIGLLSAVALARYVASLLYGVRPRDPLTLLLVAGALLVVAAVAIAIPARRASRVDPMIALRYE